MPLIQTAKEAGYMVIVIDRDPAAPGFLLSDCKIIQSTYNTVGVVDALHVLEKKCQFCGLLARASGPALNTAAAIAEEFNLPGLSTEIVPLSTEKSKLRDFCKSHGILMPKGQKVAHSKDLTPHFKLPLIVKPDLPLMGKKDVRVIWRTEDLNLAIVSAVKSSGNDFAEVEEYVDGIDVSSLIMFKHGRVQIISYWDELIGLTDNNNIKGIGVSIPSVIESSGMSKKLKDSAEIIGHYFKSINTLIILSFRVDFSGQPYLIEMHGDLGGDLIADILLPLAYPGFNFFDMALGVSINHAIDGLKIKAKPTCMIYNVNQYNDSLIQDAVIFGDNFCIQSESLSKNLDRLRLLLNNSRISLTKMPSHAEWINKKKKTVRL